MGLEEAWGDWVFRLHLYATTESFAKRGVLEYGKEIHFRSCFEGKVCEVSKKVDFSIPLCKFGLSHRHRCSIVGPPLVKKSDSNFLRCPADDRRVSHQG
jgi:hypothetical protein